MVDYPTAGRSEWTYPCSRLQNSLQIHPPGLPSKKADPTVASSFFPVENARWFRSGGPPGGLPVFLSIPDIAGVEYRTITIAGHLLEGVPVCREPVGS